MGEEVVVLMFDAKGKLLSLVDFSLELLEVTSFSGTVLLVVVRLIGVRVALICCSVILVRSGMLAAESMFVGSHISIFVYIYICNAVHNFKKIIVWLKPSIKKNSF